MPVSLLDRMLRNSKGSLLNKDFTLTVSVRQTGRFMLPTFSVKARASYLTVCPQKSIGKWIKSEKSSGRKDLLCLSAYRIVGLLTTKTVVGRLNDRLQITKGPLRAAKSPSRGSTTATRCHGWLLADVAERCDNEISLLIPQARLTAQTRVPRNA